MATAVLNRHGFPDGTVVGAWPAQNSVNGGPPSGSATASATVTSGILTFSGLTTGQRYVAYASGRAVAFRADETLGVDGAGSFAPERRRVDYLEASIGLDAVGAVRDRVDVLEPRVDSTEADMAVVRESPINVDYPEHGGSIQSAINALGQDAGAIFLPPRLHTVTTAPTLPVGSPTNRHQLVRFIGPGATLRRTTSGDLITRALPANTAAGAVNLLWRFRFEGIRFEGTATAGQRGVFLPCSYGSVFRECEFHQLDEGVDAVWALMARFEQCLGFRNIGRLFKVRSANGLWGDATVASTGSNMAVFDQCRDDCASGQLSSFYIVGSDNAEIRSCISEGLNPVCDVEFDPDGIGSVLRIVNFHNENAPSAAVIKAPVRQRLIVDGLATIHTGNLVDVSGALSTAEIQVSNIGTLPGGAKFRHGTSLFGPVWYFRHIGTSGTPPDLTAGTFWDTTASGVAPELVSQERLDTGSVTGANYPVRAGNVVGIVAEQNIQLSTVAVDFDTAYLEGAERADPGAPAANHGLLYFRDNGSGKTQLVARFPTGAVQVIATEP